MESLGISRRHRRADEPTLPGAIRAPDRLHRARLWHSAFHRVEARYRIRVERDRGLRRVAANQIDHVLEELDDLPLRTRSALRIPNYVVLLLCSAQALSVAARSLASTSSLRRSTAHGNRQVQLPSVTVAGVLIRSGHPKTSWTGSTSKQRET